LTALTIWKKPSFRDTEWQYFEDMPVLPIDIETLIPHRDRMKLISDVLDVNADRAVTSSIVSDQWPLFKGASVDPIVLIELVAQTAAVYISWGKGGFKGVGGGWIVGIKNADFFQDRIPIHAVLMTTVKNLYRAENYNVMEGTVMAGTELLGRVQIQVYRSETD
jgi:predicted hotdog family 3-hydroxylacyl-ACP dehydratase